MILRFKQTGRLKIRIFNSKLRYRPVVKLLIILLIQLYMVLVMIIWKYLNIFLHISSHKQEYFVPSGINTIKWYSCWKMFKSFSNNTLIYYFCLVKLHSKFTEGNRTCLHRDSLFLCKYLNSIDCMSSVSKIV